MYYGSGKCYQHMDELIDSLLSFGFTRCYGSPILDRWQRLKN